MTDLLTGKEVKELLRDVEERSIPLFDDEAIRCLRTLEEANRLLDRWLEVYEPVYHGLADETRAYRERTR